MYCKQCGAYLPDDAAACSACGCLLTPAPVPEVPARDLKDGPAPPPAAEAPVSGTPAPQPPVFGAVPGSVPPPRYQVPAYARPAGGPGNAGPGGPAGPANGAPAPQPGSFPPPSPAAPLSPTVGMGEWLWSSIVAAIPFVGFIVLLVWAFGGGAKPSKRNWARANLILYAVMAVVWVFLFVLFVGVVVAAVNDPYFYYNYYY